MKHPETPSDITEYLSSTGALAPDTPVTSAHWAYFTDKDDVKRFRTEADCRGYSVVLSDIAAGRSGEFVVVFTAKVALTPELFLEQVQAARRLSEQFNGSYDGFEHSVRKLDGSSAGPKLVICDYQPEPHWAVRI